MYSFPNSEPVHYFMCGSNCCFLTCIQVSQETGKVIWYSHLLKNFPEFVVIHTVKGFSVVNEADVLLKYLAFSMIQQMLAIWSLVPLPFLNPACRSGSFRLKPKFKGFEHYLASMWNELNSVVVWTFFDIAFLALRTPWTVWKSMTFEKVKKHVIKHYVNMIWFCQDFVYMCEYMHICKGDIWKKKSQMVIFICIFYMI